MNKPNTRMNNFCRCKLTQVRKGKQNQIKLHTNKTVNYVEIHTRTGVMRVRKREWIEIKILIYKIGITWLFFHIPYLISFVQYRECTYLIWFCYALLFNYGVDVILMFYSQIPGHLECAVSHHASCAILSNPSFAWIIYHIHLIVGLSSCITAHIRSPCESPRKQPIFN